MPAVGKQTFRECRQSKHPHRVTLHSPVLLIFQFNTCCADHIQDKIGILIAVFGFFLDKNSHTPDPAFHGHGSLCIILGVKQIDVT